MTKREFVKRMAEACEIALMKGAKFDPAVVVAQAALESNWGNSGLTKQANNLFGIKAGSSWRGSVLNLPTREWSKARGWYRTTAKWRKYPSWNECIVDYSNTIQRLSWFRDALPHVNNSDKFLRALLPDPGQPGWATDPNYFSKVKATAAIVERLGGPKWQ